MQVCSKSPWRWLHFPFISDSYRQALFDQPQHAPIHHALLDQDDQLVVRNGREVAAEINLYHAPGSPIQVVANRRRGHLRVSLRTVAVRTWVKVGLKDRFPHQLHRSLHKAILKRPTPQWSIAPLRTR